MRPVPTAQTRIVETVAGPVRGRVRQGSVAFLGVPYAEPPVGERRFEAPVPRSPWTEVRDALEYGPTPQRKALSEVTTIPEPSIPGDDTLTVNVFTPSPSSDGPRLPVLVYIHGGGYIAGSPASPWYDGAAFNRDGVVVVTIAYRLGFDGFGWLPDAPSNRGVLDQLLALRWVQDNIDRFGGDPARVTIAGQSAGGGAVMTLLTTPAARGLFAQAAALSPAPADIPLERASATTAEVAARLGVTADRAGFLSVPEADLIAAQDAGFEPAMDPTADDLLAMVRSIGSGAMLAYGPVLDGELHATPVTEALEQGAGRGVPLLMGTTRDEFSGFVRANRHLFQDSDVVETLERAGLDAAAAARFAAALEGEHPGDVVARSLTDRVFRRHVARWATIRREAAAPTWVYDFAWPSPVDGIAGHCLDVPFVFDVLDDPAVERVAGPNPPQDLADRVHRAYVRFITEGDPGWPSSERSGEVQILDLPWRLETGGYTSARALLA